MILCLSAYYIHVDILFFNTLVFCGICYMYLMKTSSTEIGMYGKLNINILFYPCTVIEKADDLQYM